MRKIVYNKLIRDKIPTKNAHNTTYKIKKLSQKQFMRQLLKKVGEEASALPRCKTNEEITKELADIIDVIEEIKKQRKIKTIDIVKAQKHNRTEKGGFMKRIFLLYTLGGTYITNEHRYRK
jgi:predicted house-cleaning noncanonical NTP pyrophosphatase (MazG superfamily)